jgi:ribosomal protein S12 methylthiotransferase
VLGQRPGAARKLNAQPVVSFVSLGCAKNLVDSERMLGELAQSGAVLSSDESQADTVVVNTCGFLESSRAEALEIIRELAERKRAGGLKRLIVAGCLVQRDGEQIRRQVPEVDALVGVNNRDDVVRAVWRMDRDSGVSLYLGDYHGGPWSDQARVRLTPRHYAYVRISEGCDQKCTFCTIPSIRGPMHSKPPEQIVAECRELIADGARELILIGQDTTSYGQDIDYRPGLAGLLRTLDRECVGADWLRLMYVYPSVMTDEIIDAIAECERVVKYIDIPLQHISDRVLRRMYRRVTRADTEALLDKLRRRIPDVTIRTTFIVGFPGETESEFQELLEFLQSAQFDAAGAFKYSREAETPSGRMKEQLDERTIAQRYERLMLAQQEIAFAAARRRVGKRFEIVIDDNDERGAIGRHAGQAPEVDAACILVDEESAPGAVLRVRCIDTDDYDLVVARAKSSRSTPRRR